MPQPKVRGNCCSRKMAGGEGEKIPFSPVSFSKLCVYLVSPKKEINHEKPFE